MDADLAALLWQLMEAGVPLTVAGPADSGRATLLAALTELRPAGVPLPPTRLPAIAEADSLADLDARLAAPPFLASDDERRTLGVVLVLGRGADPGERTRVVAAHYVRPLERDGHGHVQRRPPAVLATWDPAIGRFDDYAWGILPELAARAGVAAPDFETERHRRAAFLADLATAGVVEPDAAGRALAGYAATGAASADRH
jgi:hypothetical protein